MSYKIQVKTAKCKECASPLVQVVDIICPEFKQPIGKVKIFKEEKLRKSNNWYIKHIRFECSNKKCKVLADPNYRPQLGYSMEELKDVLRYSTYKVKNINLYEYTTNFFNPLPKKRLKFLKKYTGELVTTTPKLASTNTYFNAVEKISIDPKYIVVSTTRAGFIAGIPNLYLIKVEEFKKLTSLESTKIIQMKKYKIPPA